MWLPVPSSDAVKSFQAITLEEFGIVLDDQAALRVATQILRIHFIRLHENSDLREKVQ
jgi:hypothetical protein